MKDTDNLLVLTRQVSQHLLTRHIKVCTAESCTGGGLAQVLTALPGSSAWFECGFVTYSNISKQKLLMVPADTLTKEGAVSEATAMAMAKGALAMSDADLSIAITGIAGPQGATADKPVGLVWFACYLKSGKTISHSEHFHGDRTAVREQAVVTALKMILQI